jgi:PA14 domain
VWRDFGGAELSKDFDAMRRIGYQLAALAVLVACGDGGAGAGLNAGGGANANASGNAGTEAGAHPSGGANANAGGSGNASGAGGASASGAADGGASGSAHATAGGGAGGSAGVGGAAGTAGSAGALVLVGTGTIGYERWEGVKGEAVGLVPVNDVPTVTLQLAKFQMPDDVGQDFGARMRGFLTAPVTGDYTFWISCDDNGELSLSTDESPSGKQRIAYVSGSPAWTDYVQWDKFPTQKSTPVALVAGKRYYVEALLKEDIAEDHLAIGWLKPGQIGTLPTEIVPGQQLSPFEP